MKDELQSYDRVKKLDPTGKFTLTPVESCKVTKTQIDVRELRKCGKKWNGKHMFLDQIIYPNGGQDLYVLKEYTNVINIVDLLRALVPVVNGLAVLYDMNICHQDIKPDNIVYNMNTKRAYLIDFGLSVMNTKIFEEDNDTFTDYVYRYYPPEYSIFHMLMKNPKTVYTLNRNRTKMILKRVQKNLSDQMVHQFAKSMLNICPELEKEAHELMLDNIRHQNNVLELVRQLDTFVNGKNLRTAFSKAVDGKIDIYSFGVTLAEIALAYEPQLQQLRSKNPAAVHAFYKFICEAIDVNVLTRLSPHKAVIEWEMTVAKFQRRPPKTPRPIKVVIKKPKKQVDHVPSPDDVIHSKTFK
jgi:serine/threonine protein kinase